MKSIILVSWLLAFTVNAQNFAVMHAKDDPASVGIPDFWPVEVRPVGDAQQLPARFKAPWVLATQVQLNEWYTTNALAKAAWNAAQEAAATKPKRDRETAIQNAIADLKLIRDSSGTLTAAQLSNAVRVISKALVTLIEELRP